MKFKKAEHTTFVASRLNDLVCVGSDFQEALLCEAMASICVALLFSC